MFWMLKNDFEQKSENILYINLKSPVGGGK